MTAHDLILELSRYPGDMPVVMDSPSDYVNEVVGMHVEATPFEWDGKSGKYIPTKTEALYLDMDDGSRFSWHAGE